MTGTSLVAAVQWLREEGSLNDLNLCTLPASVCPGVESSDIARWRRTLARCGSRDANSRIDHGRANETSSSRHQIKSSRPIMNSLCMGFAVVMASCSVGRMWEIL